MFNTCRLSRKIQKYVGWVEERNPTLTDICWIFPYPSSIEVMFIVMSKSGVLMAVRSQA
ncbi:hypothetical protein [Scytonema hofmannii]|uniref:hypothetical protein n=1 Tax=Scytonema hofmannii TaxID=34078 RepID=UPI00034B531E|nr:hypothetical protein [Scytonema hofmannii]